MKNKDQNIDRLYRDILQNAEANQPVDAWSKLNKDLDFADKSRKIIYYRRFAAVAAIVLIFMMTEASAGKMRRHWNSVSA